ncbi:MAG: DUF433 domain-containing protein [Fimbriimonadales bacterium]|nr:DUF433 domain-containing protein [Fimbriimonadales bacterium]
MPARVVIDPTIQHGKPVIEGTRVPVARVLGELASGANFEEVARDYGLTEAQIRAALQFAAELIDAEQFYPLSTKP